VGESFKNIRRSRPPIRREPAISEYHGVKPVGIYISFTNTLEASPLPMANFDPRASTSIGPDTRVFCSIFTSVSGTSPKSESLLVVLKPAAIVTMIAFCPSFNSMRDVVFTLLIMFGKFDIKRRIVLPKPLC